jgi:type I restriction enzyme M protein
VPKLLKREGDELEIHYRHTLEELGKEPGLIGVIFRKAQNKIQDPAKLRRLIADLIADLIDKEEWSSLDTDVKGDAYEGLLQKNAEDVKGGARQYFSRARRGESPTRELLAPIGFTAGILREVTEIAPHVCSC